MTKSGLERKVDADDERPFRHACCVGRLRQLAVAALVAGSERDMRQFSVGVDIAAPSNVVWNLIARFEHWPDWGTTISQVAVEEAVVAPGVTGRVRTIAGLWLGFEITEVEAGRSWTWRVAGRTATGHIVTPRGAAGSRLDFTVGWILLPYVLPMWLAVRRIRALAEARIND